MVGKLAEEDKNIGSIVVDDTGVGGGVTDKLRANPPPGVRIIAFNGGAAARRPKRYANAITEAWLELADAFRNGTISIDRNEALITQLSSRKRIVQGDRVLRLEPKKDYKSRTGASPDDADALAMTTVALRSGPRVSWA